MSVVLDVLLFRRMIAPALLQILFWAGVGGCVYGAYVLLQFGHWAWWLPLTAGVLATRVLFEIAMLSFRVFERLGEIRDILARSEKSDAS